MASTKARILHVDDNQDSRLLIAALLSQCGYGVATVGSVAEALQVVAEVSFDLCILDVRLPDGTGLELCQSIRKMRPKLPVLYYSAYADEEEQREALRVSGDAYLRKPVCLDELQQTVEGLLKENFVPSWFGDSPAARAVVSRGQAIPPEPVPPGAVI